jgi:hypothetical protein
MGYVMVYNHLSGSGVPYHYLYLEFLAVWLIYGKNLFFLFPDSLSITCFGFSVFFREPAGDLRVIILSIRSGPKKCPSTTRREDNRLCTHLA